MSSSDEHNERREHSLWKTRLFIVWVIAFSLTDAYILHRITDDRATARRVFAQSDYQNCVRTADLLVQLIRPGIENTAKLDYYKTHPFEKALVLQQIHESLKLADPTHCNSLPSRKYR